MMPSQIYFALLTDGGIHLTIFFYLCRIIHGASIIGSWVKFFFNHGCLQFKCDRFIELQKLKILFHSQIDHLVISFIGLQKHEGLLFSFM